MIDIKLLREDPDRVRACQRARGEDEGVVDAILAADERRRSSLTEFERLRAEQKSLGKQVAAGPGRGEAGAARADQGAGRRGSRRCRRRPTRPSSELDTLRAADRQRHRAGVPVGGEDDYVVLETVGEPRDFAEGFEPRDHLELGEALGAIDMERGAKVVGLAVLLPHRRRRPARARRCSTWRSPRPSSAGFTPMITPTLVKPEVMEGTGFLDAHADEVYRLEADDLYLVGTSEVPLAGYHSDEILDLSDGPLRYAGWSPCFRREAGSYGKDTRGIIRVHQFDKVEMFVYCRPEDAEAEHQRLLGWEKEMLAKIELPYRVIDIAAGDLGGPAARKFDCEAWVPTQGRYRELTSTSNCTTFQARRLDIRVPRRGRQAADRGHAQRHAGHHALDRRDPGEPPAGRRLGRVPEALRPYLGLEVLKPVRPAIAGAGRHDRAPRRPRPRRHDRHATTGSSRAAVRDAVQAVADAGVHVVIATGRSIIGHHARSSSALGLSHGLRRVLQRRRHVWPRPGRAAGTTRSSRR